MNEEGRGLEETANEVCLGQTVRREHEHPGRLSSTARSFPGFIGFPSYGSARTFLATAGKLMRNWYGNISVL